MTTREPDKKKTAELETFWEKMASGQIKTHDIGTGKEPTNGLVNNAAQQVINKEGQKAIDTALRDIKGTGLRVFRFMGGEVKHEVLQGHEATKFDPKTNTLLVDTGPKKMAKGTLQRELSKAITDAAVQRVLDVLTFKNHKPAVMHVQNPGTNRDLKLTPQ